MAINPLYTKKVLQNGLTLLTVPIESAASVTMSVFLKVGSRYEEARIAGISHFLEHLHFKGCEGYPTAKQLSEVVDSIGGEFNANTGNAEVVRAITRKDILAYREKYYEPNNTIIAVSGHFDQLKLEELVHKHWE